MRKHYLLMILLLSVLAAQGQSGASAPCENPKYPINNITNKPPVPPASWRAPQSAVVGVDLTIDTNGNVETAEVVSSGGKDADDAVLKAVRNWTYLPAMCGSQPVQIKIRVKVTLQLGKAKD